MKLYKFLPVDAATNKRRDNMTMLLFPREIGLKRRLCRSQQEYDNYINKINGKASCYTSLYNFERLDPVRSWKPDLESVIIDRAWWDFDMLEGGTLNDVKLDVVKLLNRLEGDVRLVFTGRGFHIHQFFEKKVFGTSMVKHIDRYQRKMSKGLNTLDGVGHPQKLTRVPDTYNITRGKWAVNVDKEAFMADPLGYVIPIRPDPTLIKNDPFVGDIPNSSFSIVKWVANNPIQLTVHNNLVFDGEIGTMKQIPIPPCLDSATKVENPRHEVRLALVQHLAENLRWFAPVETVSISDKKIMVESIVDYLESLNWRDFNRNTSKFHVESIINYDNAPSCAWIKARGLCVGSCWRDDGTA